jgi:hypothetical protein
MYDGDKLHIIRRPCMTGSAKLHPVFTNMTMTLIIIIIIIPRE